MFGDGGKGLQFSLLGIPVSVNWTFLVVPLFASSAGWRATVTWTSVVFFSVLLHELGHGIAMRAFGFQPRISIYALGGLTAYPTGAAPTIRQSFLISGAGPAVSITLGGLSYAAASFVSSNTLAGRAVGQMEWINLVWGALNLLPLMPLDGGNLLDAGASMVTGKPRPRWVGLVAMFTGVLVIVLVFKQGPGFLAKLRGQTLLAVIGGFSILNGWNRWRSNAVDFDHALNQAIGLAWSGEREAAERALLVLRQIALTHEQHARVTQELAWVYFMNGRLDACEAELKKMPEGWQVAPELRARLFAAKDDVDGVIATLVPEVAAGQLGVTAAPLLGSALMAREKFEGVEAIISLMLSKASGRDDPPGRVAADLTSRLFRANQPEACLRMCEVAWKKFSRGEDAFNAACSLVRLGRPDEAMRWLADAVRVGMADLTKSLETDEDVAPLRSRADFAAILEQLRAGPTAAT